MEQIVLQFAMFAAMCGGFALIWRTVNKGNKGNGGDGQSTVNTPAIGEIKTLVEATSKNVDSLATNLKDHRAEVLEELSRHRKVMGKLFDQDSETNLRVSENAAKIARVEGQLRGAAK